MTTIAPIPRVPRTPEALTSEQAVRRAHVRPAQKRRLSLSVTGLTLMLIGFLSAGFALALLTT